MLHAPHRQPVFHQAHIPRCSTISDVSQPACYPPCVHAAPRRYFALCGIAILLLIVRVLRRMDFQPNLGVVTRSLWLAGSDLIHFAIVFFMVFIIYAMLAHLVFGHTIQKFSTFDSSVSTCFEVRESICFV